LTWLPSALSTMLTAAPIVAAALPVLRHVCISTLSGFETKIGYLQ
jgi:hypothetical protein